MFDNIIAYSIKNKVLIGVLVVALIVWGLFSLRQLPIDAVPDITNNQIQVLTTSPNLATQEIEQFITTPVELALQNIQKLVEIRSVSRFGLSVVTIVFEESMDIYLARQLVNEHLKETEETIPEGFGIPQLAPISTGLGEIYQYIVRPEEGYEEKYSSMDLRSIQDWIVKRQLSGIEGVVEVNTLGGHLKQYEVAIDPSLLKSMGLSVTEVFEALENSNQNTGGAYIEKMPSTFYIRSNGLAKTLKDIEAIVVKVQNGIPILIRDVATVQYGKSPRYGAITRDGKEVVGATVMMLKGANSALVTERIKERVIQVQKSLPEGVVIEPYLVRDKLISRAIKTVKTNLIEGGLIVIFILVIMLGNLRAGLIVSSVIPLAMLFAIGMMNVFGISANLMSLGAIDFGLIVDGAVIIVESIVHRLKQGFGGTRLSATQMDSEVKTASQKIRNSAAFGEIIILIVYIPILALVGIEGKMFRPMAQTVMFAILGALVLSLTYVPMMSALFLNKNISNKITIADRIIDFFYRMYKPVLKMAMRFKIIFVIGVILLFVWSFGIYTKMGGEFIPTLEEGDFALHQILPPGSSLSQSVETSKIIQDKLMKEFPEIEDIVTKIGSSEIPTDPMPVETGDIIVVMKPKSEWTSASSRLEMFEKFEHSLMDIPGVGYEFSQPIQMRFNELMTGSRADITVKLYGNDLDLLYEKAKEAESHIRKIAGIGSIKVEQTIGMPQIVVNFKYNKLAQYGLQVGDVNRIIKTAFAGQKAGIIYEEDRRFDLVVRMNENFRKDINSVQDLYIPIGNGTQVPLSELATVELSDAPMQISRDNTNRRIVIGVNVGNTDVETLAIKIQNTLEADMDLPAGYFFTYGGQFENLKEANARLGIAVPIALALIFILLFFTFKSLSQAALIFTAIPLSAIGGILALQLRGMPFSISAGVGFIALFGVAVLNGIVLIGYFNQLKKEGMTDINKRIKEGTRVRLRPVIMTAAVASLGFLPMALSNSGGAEVQRPLATVVIGGLITATFLTMIILPILYSWLASWQEKNVSHIEIKSSLILIPFFLFQFGLNAQTPVSLDEAINLAIRNHPDIKASNYQIEKNTLLKNVKYSPGNTVISYQGEGLFKAFDDRVNQLRVVQNFVNPAIVKAQNLLYEEMVTQSGITKILTENDIRLKVQQLYFNIQYQKEMLKLSQELESLYSDYLQKADTRLRLGESNSLEKLNIESQLKEYNLKSRQSSTQIANLQKNLQTIMNSQSEVTTIDEFGLIPLPIRSGESDLFTQVSAQNILIESAKTNVLKARLKPSFNVGYGAQNYFNSGWKSALQAGIQLPLFAKGQNQEIQAQSIQIDVAKAKLESAKLDIQQRKNSAMNSIEMYSEGVNFYQNQLEKVNPELRRISDLIYDAGDLDYLELLNYLDLLAKNKKGLIDQLLAYNQSVVFYQFLSNLK